METVSVELNKEDLMHLTEGLRIRYSLCGISSKGLHDALLRIAADAFGKDRYHATNRVCDHCST